jgi:glycerol-3-phosphate dehydrogenase (NAD(P)+)
MSQSGTKIGVIGGGAWGTALAALARSEGANVTLWAREPDVVESVNRVHRNTRFLPGIALEAQIRATGDLAEAAAADVLLLVSPAQHLRSVCRQLSAAPVGAAKPSLVICSKGIEITSGAMMSEVVAAELPDWSTAVLSGPTLAHEVAQGLPTAVTLACGDRSLGHHLAELLGRPHFRCYYSPDVIGAQIGGALKNVIALGCGIVRGRKLGENASAAFLTRGFAEMVRLGRAKGARPETLMGLSGIGDLVLTCHAERSRNMSLGLALGQGEELNDILKSRRTVAEGVATAEAVVALAESLGVEMPISGGINSILHHQASIDSVMRALLARPVANEWP